MKHLTLFLFIVFLCACSRPQQLQPLDSDSTILAFGDSLTQGVGTSSENAYPQVLAELTGLKVINAGISGETTYEGADRFARTIQEHQPALVILLEGGNDILRNMPLNESKNNLAQMIRLAHEQQIDIVLIGVPRKNLFSESANFYHELAEEYQLVFEPSIIAELMKTPRYKSDSIHFNSAGYRVLAERVRTLLEKHGALDN